jgi:Lsr2
MGQRVVVEYLDDLDGQTADETVTFGLDGVSYEIDLTAEHAADIRELLSPLINHAKRIGGRSKTGRHGASQRRSDGSSQSDVAGIREWAKQNDIPIAVTGRIPEHVRERYNQAVSTA